MELLATTTEPDRDPAGYTHHSYPQILREIGCQ